MLLIIMTAVMVMGILTAYAIGNMLVGSVDDVHTEPREYVVTGQYGGTDVTGTGKSTYTAESRLEYSHQVDTTVGLPGEEKVSTSFMYFFTEDGPVDLYKFVGEMTLGDKIVDVWQYDVPEATVTFMVDDDLKIVQYTLKGEMWNVTGTIIE